VKPLSLADHRHVEAAKGWCEFRSFNDAYAELEEITADHWAHPAALEVRWTIYANLGKWEGALDLADIINQLKPDEPRGYIYIASSLRELGRYAEAIDLLMAAVQQFPREGIILYGIAWLYCLSGRLDLARPWLAKAMKAGSSESRKRATPHRYSKAFPGGSQTAAWEVWTHHRLYGHC
jgi:tetratricopeptide (TPR) repeat protein